CKELPSPSKREAAHSPGVPLPPNPGETCMPEQIFRRANRQLFVAGSVAVLLKAKSPSAVCVAPRVEARTILPPSPSASTAPTARDPRPESLPGFSPPPLPEFMPDPMDKPPDLPEKSEVLPPELQEILARFPAEPEIIPPLSSSPTSASAKIF